MSERTCAICGAQGAPFGLRLPGPRSALPENKRGHLWTCAREDCRKAAEERRAKKTGAR